MSSRSYSRDDRRYDDRSRDRRRSPGPSRRSPSPPPKPRDDKELPEAFGRIPDAVKDDDSNVLFRMTNGFKSAPLGALSRCLDKSRKVKVWTRNFKEVRGICTGYIIAFDKHWNLVMNDVDEVFLKPRKAKTPYLDDVNDAAHFAELPKKVPKKKKEIKAEKDAEPTPVKEPEVVEIKAEGAEKKKKRRKKRKGPTTLKRHIDRVFVRGDNIVMAAVLDSEGSDREQSD